MSPLKDSANFSCTIGSVYFLFTSVFASSFCSYLSSSKLYYMHCAGLDSVVLC